MAQKKLPKATHQGNLDLNGFDFNSTVLEDGKALFAERNIATALGIKGGGAYWKKKKTDSAVLPEYLSARYLQPFITNELREKLDSAVDYIAVSGTKARGVDATILSDICDVYITAQKELQKRGIRYPTLDNVAENAYRMIKAFSKVGIIALVYEATGYDKIKEKDILQKFLAKFLLEEKGKWVKTFQDEFFEAIFKMKGWTWTLANKGRKPQFLGHYINNYVYSRLAPNVLEELRKRNPKDEKGNRKGKFTQWISPEFGHPKLTEHLTILVAFAKASSYNWTIWDRMVKRAYPKFGKDGSAAPELDFPEDMS